MGGSDLSRRRDGLWRFGDTVGSLPRERIWEFASGISPSYSGAATRVAKALSQPLDYPVIDDAIVSGDHVVIAIDPDIPQAAEIARGVVERLIRTAASEVSVVLGETARDPTVAEVRAALDPRHQVHRHRADARESLRYVAADDAAEPIYLNRQVIDADVVIPVLAQRPIDHDRLIDPIGLFPAFADSATRRRFFDRVMVPDRPALPSPPIAYLVGVQLIVAVNSDADGAAGRILAGTPEAISKQTHRGRRDPDDFPPAAMLVVASLDGDRQQQTWLNAARAAAAATQYAEPNATIVLWTDLNEPPSGRLRRLGTDPSSIGDADEPAADLSADGFPVSDPDDHAADLFLQVTAEHRVLIRSEIDADEIESIGLGVVGTAEELLHLLRSHSSCGVLRAAQFAGTTFATPQIADRRRPHDA